MESESLPGSVDTELDNISQFLPGEHLATNSEGKAMTGKACVTSTTQYLDFRKSATSYVLMRGLRPTAKIAHPGLPHAEVF